MSTKAFTAQLFRWLAQVNADGKLPPSAAKIAIGLVPYFNEDEGGMAWPGFDTLADDVALSKSVVIDGLRKMAAHGHLKVEAGRRGRGHSSHYWMIEKGRPSDLSEQRKGRTAPPRKGWPSDRKGRPADLTLSKTHTGSREPVCERESFDLLTQIDDPHACAGAPKGARAEEGGSKRRSDKGSRYAELRAAWPRPWPDDDRADRRAFEQAIWEGADPDDIVEAARAWAEAADAPRYLPTLAKWLNGRGWEHDPPPPKRRHRNGRKPDLARMVLAMAGDVEVDGTPMWGGV